MKCMKLYHVGRSFPRAIRKHQRDLEEAKKKLAAKVRVFVPASERFPQGLREGPLSFN